MNCNEISERLGEYWDLSDSDPIRSAVDEHIATCDSCREEFEIWRESANLIQSTRLAAAPVLTGGTVSQGVMNRIYKDESWRLPVAFRAYTFSYRVRRNIMACIAMCLAVFVVSFMFTFGSGTSEEPDISNFTGIVETAHAQSVTPDDRPAMFDDIPVASISAPSLLQVGPIETYTDYLLAVSIIGFIFTLLIMNWLSRLRA